MRFQFTDSQLLADSRLRGNDELAASIQLLADSRLRGNDELAASYHGGAARINILYKGVPRRLFLQQLGVIPAQAGICRLYFK